MAIYLPYGGNTYLDCNYAPTTPASIMCWVKGELFASSLVSTLQYIVAFDSDEGSYTGGIAERAGYMCVTIGNITDGDAALWVPIVSNRWYHVVATFADDNGDGSNSNGATIYVYDPIANTSISVYNAFSTPVPFGSMVKLFVGNSTAYISGCGRRITVAEVSIWNKELTATDVQRYRYCRLTGAEPNLLNYWPLMDANTGTAVVLKDLTKNKLDLTMNGFNTPASTIIESCDATTGWAASGQATAPAIDNVTFLEGSGSLKMGKSGIVTNSSTYTKTFGAPIDISNCMSSVWLYITDTAKLRATGAAITCTLYNADLSHSLLMSYTRLRLANGWNCLYNSSLMAASDFNDCDHLVVTFYSAATGTLITSGDLKLDWWVAYIPSAWAGHPPIKVNSQSGL